MYNNCVCVDEKETLLEVIFTGGAVVRKKYDKIIIGAGLYGLYAALFCGKKGEKIIVLECEKNAFSRATYVNQARVHQGYHYPRSLSTAVKSAGYFERFNKDFAFCINREFDKVYATSSKFSWSDGEQFKIFCKNANIPCKEVHPNNYFRDGMCDGAFLTREYTYDAMILKDHFLSEISKFDNIEIKYGVNIAEIDRDSDYYVVRDEERYEYQSDFVLNATYAGINQILDKVKFEKFKIKYELCEIILCDVNEKLSQCGITVMDGPFFSIMPFGKTGLHSLTSVTFTPHATSFEELPQFICQLKSGGFCTSKHLGNCNLCKTKPDTAFPYMENLAKKYLNSEYGFRYKNSLFSIKPILTSSEVDDSRPTVIRVSSSKPTFVTVLSGKINTVYDLEEVLCNER